MLNYKLAVATFRRSEYQDGDEVLKFMNRDVRRFGKPKHTKEHVQKDSNGFFFLSRLSENSELKQSISSKLLRA